MRFQASFPAVVLLIAISTCRGQNQPAEEAYKRGAEAFRQQKYSEAAEAFLAAAHPDPGFKDALEVRAKALIQLNRLREAEESLHEYLKVRPASANAKFLLGYVLFRENQPAKSLAIYTAAAALQRPVPGDFKIVGLDYVLLNDYPGAIRWLERSVRENPKDVEAVYYLGRAYYAQNLFEKAIAAFEQALKLNPLYAKAHNNLGLALAAQNKLELAEQAYRRAIEVGEQTGKKSEQPYINLAELWIDHNRVAEALGLLDTAKQIDPKAERLEQLRGRALLSQERFEEAEAAFRAAIALKPDSGVLHYQLGRVLKRMGRNEESKKEFERSKELFGTHSALP
jgi:tetratricopeptide (TPR) repeat protein